MTCILMEMSAQSGEATDGACFPTIAVWICAGGEQEASTPGLFMATCHFPDGCASRPETSLRASGKVPCARQTRRKNPRRSPGNRLNLWLGLARNSGSSHRDRQGTDRINRDGDEPRGVPASTHRIQRRGIPAR